MANKYIVDTHALIWYLESNPRLGAAAKIEIQPLCLEILQASLQARAVPEMHDRLIVAGGLLLQQQGDRVTILTKDVSITTAALLPVLWN